MCFSNALKIVILFLLLKLGKKNHFQKIPFCLRNKIFYHFSKIPIAPWQKKDLVNSINLFYKFRCILSELQNPVKQSSNFICALS
jgi:hypothetical protein